MSTWRWNACAYICNKMIKSDMYIVLTAITYVLWNFSLVWTILHVSLCWSLELILCACVQLWYLVVFVLNSLKSDGKVKRAKLLSWQENDTGFACVDVLCIVMSRNYCDLVQVFSQVRTVVGSRRHLVRFSTCNAYNIL